MSCAVFATARGLVVDGSPCLGSQVSGGSAWFAHCFAASGETWSTVATGLMLSGGATIVRSGPAPSSCVTPVVRSHTVYPLALTGTLTDSDIPLAEDIGVRTSHKLLPRRSPLQTRTFRDPGTEEESTSCSGVPSRKWSSNGVAYLLP